MSDSSEGRGAAVEVVDLTVAFGDTLAVDGLSVSIPAGQTLAVLGPSGSGKSTLLRAIAGLDPVRHGTIRVDGADQRDVPSHRRQLGLMFQDHALFPHMDVAANVAFGLDVRGDGPSEIERRVTEVLDLVGLDGFDRRDVTTLSGGEAQRVALARALAPSPRVLMLDEPLGSLDRVLREGLVTELRELFTRLDVTVLHVTHDQQEAFSLADEVLVMRDGAVVQHGAPAEVWSRPVDRFAAAFLGHPNIWADAEGDVLAPIPSLSIVPSQSEIRSDGPLGENSDGVPEGGNGEGIEHVRATLVGAEFREGRWRLTLDEVAGASRSITLDNDRPFPIGSPLIVRIDRSALHRLGRSA